MTPHITPDLPDGCTITVENMGDGKGNTVKWYQIYASNEAWAILSANPYLMKGAANHSLVIVPEMGKKFFLKIHNATYSFYEYTS